MYIEKISSYVQSTFTTILEKTHYFLTIENRLWSAVHHIFASFLSVVNLSFSYLLGRASRVEKGKVVKVLRVAQAIICMKPKNGEKFTPCPLLEPSPQLPQIGKFVKDSDTVETCLNKLSDNEKKLLWNLQYKLDVDLTALREDRITLCFSDDQVLEIDGFLKEGLANSSEFFKVLFKGGFKESQAPVISIQDLTSTEFKWLVHYHYWGKEHREMTINEACNLLRFDRIKFPKVSNQGAIALQCFIEKQVPEVFSLLPFPPEKKLPSYEILKNFKENGSQIATFFLMANELGLSSLEKTCQQYFNFCVLTALSSDNLSFNHFMAEFNLLPLNLNGLNLDHISYAHLKRLKHFSSIESLKIKSVHSITSKNLNFPEMPNLKSLTVEFSNLSSQQVSQLIQRCPNLVDLNLLRYTNVTDEIIKEVGCLLQLDNLIIGAVETLDLTPLQNCPILRNLDVADCLQLRDANVESISKIPQLQKLILANTDITDEGVRHLTGCKSLQDLNLLACHNLTIKVIPILAEIPELSKIALTIAEKPVTLEQIRLAQNA